MKYWEGKVIYEDGVVWGECTGPDRASVADKTAEMLSRVTDKGPHTAMIREVGEWEEVGVK